MKWRIMGIALVIVVGLIWAAGLGSLAYARRNAQPIASIGPITGDAHADGILKRACYDCHSDTTYWPWYSYMPGAGLLVAVDVLRARDEMNFSDWQTLPPETKAKMLEEIGEAVTEGEMPPAQYLLMHSDAVLTPQDTAALKMFGGEGSEGDEGDDDDDDDDERTGNRPASRTAAFQAPSGDGK